MNIKWKMILLVLLITIIICAIFITLFIFDSRENLKNFVDTEITSIRAIIKIIEEENNRHYLNRMASFINYAEFPEQKKIISAFARRDRDELLRLTTPYFKSFKREGSYFSTFSWLTPDNYAFLRVHHPASFGDKMDKIRPDVVAANKNRRQYSNYMISKTGLQYRLVQPISYEGQHVGVLQFGIGDGQLLDVVHKKLNIPVGMVLLNKNFSIITNPKLPSLAGTTHTIQSKELVLFQQDVNEIDWNLDLQQVSLKGKPYIIAKAFNFLNYRQESQGYIFVALDISEHKRKLQSRILLILLLSSILILISFSILYFSCGFLVQRIIDLNKKLKQSNDNLEHQVENRTIKLQNELQERKHAENALFIEKNNLNNIFNSMTDGVYIVNQQYDIEFVNQALIDEFGAYEGKKCYKYFHDRQGVCTWCKNNEVLLGKTVRWEWYSSKNKKTYDLLDSPIILADRSIGKLEIFRDITERKKTEETLRLSKCILEASPDHISVVGRNFIYKYVNNAYSIAHGLATDQIIGMHVAELLGKQTFTDLVKPLLKKCLAGEDVQFESWFTFQKAGQRFMSIKYLPLWTKSDKVDGCVVLSIDITKYKEAEEKIILARKTAENANKAKSAFLANMSHEIRTPLNAVNGFSELLLPLVTDKKQKNYLESIRTAGKSLLSLINDILDLSKIEADKMQIQYVPVNIQVIFDEIKQIFNIPLTGKSIEFSMDIDKNIPPLLLLDEIRLRQILLNIVGNAIKFTKDGYIKLMAKQTGSKNNKRKIDLEISVKDTGMGIAKADQDKIFNIFEQQDGQSTRAFGGTGLGLSISKRLAKMMNGQIKVSSKVNEGSTFTILLRNIEVSTVKVPAVAEETDDTDNLVFEKAKILVVDDVRSNREFLSEVLDQADLNVRTAENGQEAILLAREYQPDVIIMDIRMPVLDGIEAAEYLKSNPETKKIPIIISSAAPNIEYKTELGKIGIDSFLSKPVTKNKLFNELAKYIAYTIKNTIDSVQSESDYLLTDIENSPELVKILKKDILPFCESLKNSGVMNDIKIFGDRVKELGKKFNVKLLIKYGEDINESAQNYDLPDIETALKTIAGMIEKLE